jgi:serine O-acetyltransferase
MDLRNLERELAEQREKLDAIGRASRETLPDTLRILEALEALRSLISDRTGTDRLGGDLLRVHGLVGALIGPDGASEVLHQLPEIRRRLSTDIEAAYQKDPAAISYGQVVACYPSFLAVSTYRIAHALYRAGHPVIARAMSEDAHSRTGIDINPGAKIGDSFFVDHGTGVVIGETCVVGRRVKLYHGVTLGAFTNKEGRADAGRQRHPTLEDDVTVYPNATILGGETVIGTGSVIGGNVWLTESVPPYTRVAIGAPDLQFHQKSPPSFGEGI